jgi:NAD(P)-dependent dehydrogenase (short-subunit alcohol dehydrogenase family)
MKIVVIGGTGLIGSKVAANLKQKGHEVLAAAPNTGVNTITGEGLKDAMAGAQVVIDLANSPHLRTIWRCNSSRPPAATFLPRRPHRAASATMSHYPSSDATGRPTLVISAPRSPKRN